MSSPDCDIKAGTVVWIKEIGNQLRYGKGAGKSLFSILLIREYVLNLDGFQSSFRTL